MTTDESGGSRDEYSPTVPEGTRHWAGPITEIVLVGHRLLDPISWAAKSPDSFLGREIARPPQRQAMSNSKHCKDQAGFGCLFALELLKTAQTLSPKEFTCIFVSFSRYVETLLPALRLRASRSSASPRIIGQSSAGDVATSGSGLPGARPRPSCLLTCSASGL
jgi:hypothetical protein